MCFKVDSCPYMLAAQRHISFLVDEFVSIPLVMELGILRKEGMSMDRAGKPALRAAFAAILCAMSLVLVALFSSTAWADAGGAFTPFYAKMTTTRKRSLLSRAPTNRPIMA